MRPKDVIDSITIQKIFLCLELNASLKKKLTLWFSLLKYFSVPAGSQCSSWTATFGHRSIEINASTGKAHNPREVSNHIEIRKYFYWNRGIKSWHFSQITIPAQPSQPGSGPRSLTVHVPAHALQQNSPTSNILQQVSKIYCFHPKTINIFVAILIFIGPYKSYKCCSERSKCLFCYSHTSRRN